MIMTRMRIPVSTTFLILTSFAASSGAISQVLLKSLFGYVIAIIAGFIVFIFVSGGIYRYRKTSVHPRWLIAQWITSGILWSTWVMQDAANVAIYLPRSMGVFQFIFAALLVFSAIGYIFWKR